MDIVTSIRFFRSVPFSSVIRSARGLSESQSDEVSLFLPPSFQVRGHEGGAVRSRDEGVQAVAGVDAKNEQYSTDAYSKSHLSNLLYRASYEGLSTPSYMDDTRFFRFQFHSSIHLKINLKDLRSVGRNHGWHLECHPSPLRGAPAVVPRAPSRAGSHRGRDLA